MTDRDTFSAAALTGLLASMQKNAYAEEMASHAYEIADAMLRERERTNHDAAPAAIARTESTAGEPGGGHGSDRTDKAVTRPVMGTGNTQEPVAWAVDWGGGDIDCEFVFRDKKSVEEVIAENDETKGRVVPLCRSPTLTDEEREAIEQMLDEVAGKAPAASWVPATLRSLLERLK